MTTRKIRTPETQFKEFIEDKPVPKFGASISTPLLDEIIAKASAPTLALAIENTLKQQKYYKTKVCCPCGRADGCYVTRRHLTLMKDENGIPYKDWDGKLRKEWKEIPE